MLSSYRLNHVSNEDLQPVTFVPYKHAIFQSQNHHYHHHRRQSCCSILFPTPFERAAPKSFLNPRFDSIILEGQYQTSVFPQIRLRFRYCLIYVILSTITWLVYHQSMSYTAKAPNQISILYEPYIVILLTSILAYLLTFTKFYRMHTTIVSIVTTIQMCGTSLMLLLFTSPYLFSPLGHFSICIEIILLIYTMIPLRLWQNCALAALYSILFEIASILAKHNDFTWNSLLMRLMMHLCVQLVGFHILVMNVVRMRSTFIEVGQNLLVRRQLEMEKQLKEKMIHSVMPPKVADILLYERSSGDQAMFGLTNNVKCLFRPFHMASMDNVSILFADIVGFTKMSSNKTAEQLVEILNDLFQRFDDICILNSCEKISTLGDCYYCVSGYPEPRKNHASCCVEMGLGMISAMRLFDTKRQEGVNMRVGIHTGTVLCGIVGTKRVKFDVWSNDVSLANRMESTGKPGQVHVSEETFSFLDDEYVSEPGEDVEGLKTYYILRKRTAKSYEHLRPNELNLTMITSSNDHDKSTNATKLLSQSATNLAASRVLESVSPSALSTGPPTHVRTRSSTFNKLTKYLRAGVNSGGAFQSKETAAQPRQPPPKIFVSTKSLPESLTSTNPSILNCCPNSLSPINRNNSIRAANSPDLRAIDSLATTPTHTSNETSKTRHWKLPKYLRRNNNNDIKCDRDCVDSGNNENEQTNHLLPIVIQKVNTDISLGTIDSAAMNGHGFERDLNCLDTPSCSPRSNSNVNTNDIIDIRSYISQSRSDITPFLPERADSCKHRSHRSQYGDLTPMRRPRAKTLALTSQEHFIDKDTGNELKVPHTYRKTSQQSVNQLQLPDVRANHTSISQERLSTGDMCSWISNISDDPISGEQSSAIVIPANDAIHLDPIRKQSDIQMVKCVKENAKSQQNYLVAPPISKFTLFFLSPHLEAEFRDKAHQLKVCRRPRTITAPIYNTYIDIFIGIIIFTTVSMTMFSLTASGHYNDTPFKWFWVALFVTFCTLELFSLVIFTRKLFRKSNRIKSKATNRKKSTNTDIEMNDEQEPTKNASLQKSVSCTFAKSISSEQSESAPSETSCKQHRYFEDKFIDLISAWYEWHLFHGFLMTLPAILTLAHFFILDMQNIVSLLGCHYGYLMLVCIVHFCNFTQLNCWMRNALAVAVALIFIGGISLHELDWTTSAAATPTTLHVLDANGTRTNRIAQLSDWIKPHCFSDKIDLEIYVDLLLVLLLVSFLNREFEIFYRFAFYSSYVAEKDKVRVQSLKNQADLLLQNIIPKHVADHLKNTAKYSENHHDVAIIFASLINFNELYDESYLGGREYLRVLNELIGDFDELLSRPEFECVEKIKTIGSTFMAASGLDDTFRDGASYNHVNSLMQFAIAMQHVVDEFNQDLLGFDLILRIGFNVGDVTAGVIGASKLMYDIWGDAVNVASRMDSTGVAGRIQVRKDCIQFLDANLYSFEPRGKVFVKGKDDMEVFLVKPKTEQNSPEQSDS